MIGIVGYNFCSDGNAIDPTPTDINNITYTKIQNGIFDHFNVTKDIVFDYTSVIPTSWDKNTIMDADFKGDVSAGNLAQVASGVTSVRVKRRIKGTFDWITIREIPVQHPTDMSFIITDNLAAYNTEYEYAFVPMLQDVEGGYIIESILSKFQGIFICDANSIFRLQAGVEYNNMTTNQQIGVFQPYNRKYPVVVSNSLMQYKTGSIGGWVLPENFDETRQATGSEVMKQKELLLNILTNKKPKLIKDMNGNNWLVYFTGNPSATYDNNVGQSMVKINAEWTEVGDSNDKTDLFENGLIPTTR
nr:MAG TPA: hypothetical protein [Caudoviricetes sp.]